jgi:large subunit ribosomal protein L24
MALKLRKGDEVVVLAGKDIGKRGEISRVIPGRSMVIVDGVNIVKKHQKQTRQTMQAGIIDKEMPIHISNVALVCKSCGPTRVGYRFGTDGKKVRVCRKCGTDV